MTYNMRVCDRGKEELDICVNVEVRVILVRLGELFVQKKIAFVPGKFDIQ